MTRVKKSTLRGRGRYNLYSSSGYNRKNVGKIVLLSSLLIVGFILYQLLASGKSADSAGSSIAQRGGSFLKGRLGSHRAPTVGVNENESEDHPEIPEHVLKRAQEIFREKEIMPAENDAGEKKVYAFDENRILFNNFMKGKSGKVVEEMLMAHAYVFHQNATYGGCCASAATKTTVHEELLDAIGLRDKLKFRCPSDFSSDHHSRISVLPREHYTSDDTRVWTPDYVDYLRSLVIYPRKQHKEYTIAVHMLRGDVSPCRAKVEGYYRYLPNLHYQNLIDKHMKSGARVIIYTSPKSFEDMKEFRERGYEVNVDAPLKDIWKDFVTADVMIMSRSDFSMVPAMVAKGKVVYTPFWHHSLRLWERVDAETMKQTDDEIERLREEFCQEKAKQ